MLCQTLQDWSYTGCWKALMVLSTYNVNKHHTMTTFRRELTFVNTIWRSLKQYQSRVSADALYIGWLVVITHHISQPTNHPQVWCSICGQRQSVTKTPPRLCSRSLIPSYGWTLRFRNHQPVLHGTRRTTMAATRSTAPTSTGAATTTSRRHVWFNPCTSRT